MNTLKQQTKPVKTQIVKIEELYADKGLAVKQNEMNILLNSEPKAEWVKTHPIIKNYKYIPIERIEWLLTMVFQQWKIEIKSVQHVANSIVVTIRLHIFNPVLNEWQFQDGVGASPLQVDKEAGAINWDKIKSGAVQMSAPSAETFAIKDAAEKLGKLFGKDINRKDIMSYEILKDKFNGLDKVREDLKEITTLEALTKYYNFNKGRGKEFDALIIERKNQLTPKHENS